MAHHSPVKFDVPDGDRMISSISPAAPFRSRTARMAEASLSFFGTLRELGQHRLMGQGDSASVLTRAKVWKMREYWMYFPFFILHDRGKRSAEERSSHCAVLP